jgi:dienelactone hydrolase
MSRLATSHEEVPVFIHEATADLFAILTRPTTSTNETAVILAWGTGGYPTSGRNQIRTRLARRLARWGYHVLRLDYTGVAESSGTALPADLEKPWTADVIAACRWLSSVGLKQIVLVGYCFGARNVLSATPYLSGVAAVVLIGAPVADQDHVETAARKESLGWHARHAFKVETLRNLAKPRKRRKYGQYLRTKLRSLFNAGTKLATGSAPDDSLASSHLLLPLTHLVEHSVPVLLLYGTGTRFWSDFQLESNSALARLINRCEVRTIDGLDLQTAVILQDQMLDLVEEWLSELPKRMRA